LDGDPKQWRNAWETRRGLATRSRELVRDPSLDLSSSSSSVHTTNDLPQHLLHASLPASRSCRNWILRASLHTSASATRNHVGRHHRAKPPPWWPDSSRARTQLRPGKEHGGRSKEPIPRFATRQRKLQRPHRTFHMALVRYNNVDGRSRCRARTDTE